MSDADVVHYERVPDGGIWQVDLKNGVQMLVDTDYVGLDDDPVDFGSPLRIGSQSFGEPFAWMPSSAVINRGIRRKEGAISRIANRPREAFLSHSPLPVWELALSEEVIVHVKADAVVYSDRFVEFAVNLHDASETWMEAILRVERAAVTEISLCRKHSAPYDLRPGPTFTGETP
jgi:hypothetical protein